MYNLSNNMVHLHLHSMKSNPYSGLAVDSITQEDAYIEKAKECGMKAIAFTEHGSRLGHIHKRQYCKKMGIKPIDGQEFYITERIDKDENGKLQLIRDNYHCILLAKNEDGWRELNWLSSIAMNREDGHFHYNPRITIDELCNTSDNILVLTACCGGILCKGTDSIRIKFLNFIEQNKHRCWLEIQPHMFDLQIKYNQWLYQASMELGVKLVATSDIHALNKDHAMARKLMQKSKKIEFHDEDEFDLTWKDYSEMVDAFKKQNTNNPYGLPEIVYLNAIEETNHIADMIEDFELDYSVKYPRFENALDEFKKRIFNGIKERGIDKYPNFKTDYMPRIKEELETYIHNDAVDFMLLDSDYKNWLRSQGIYYGISRGSVSGSLIAYLIHCTDVDSVKFNLNFSRFMNSERVSMADIDTDIYADDRYKVREYLFEREDLHCCNIITYNTIGLKGAIKDVARAFGLTPDEAQALSDLTEKDEKNKDFMPQAIRDKYPEMFAYVDLVIGTITSIGRHAAGIVCSPRDVMYEFGTVSITSDPRPVSQIDMHEIDSLNFVKLDLLGLNAVGLIYKTCQLAGIPYPDSNNIDFNDENVIRSIAEDTTMVFQFESGYSGESLKKTLSDETVARVREKNPNVSYLDLMSMCSGAIRPAGESYREQLFQGIYKDNGNDALNEFLAPTLGFLVFQEQIIEFLHKFCGFTMGQADIVRRGFARLFGVISRNTNIIIGQNR